MSSTKSSQRRKSYILSGIDTSNVLESPDYANSSCPQRRRSMRLRRKSGLVKIPPMSGFEQQLDGDVPRDLGPETPSRSTASPNASFVPAKEKQTPPSRNNENFLVYLDSSPGPTEPTATSLSPNVSPPAWLNPRYSPPRLIGLESISEDGTLKRCRPPLRRNTHIENTLRRQFFTGQTLEEACLPKIPGAAPLDTDLVLKKTAKIVRLRRLKAKRLGFRKISVTKHTEQRIAALMTQPTSSPES